MTRTKTKRVGGIAVQVADQSPCPACEARGYLASTTCCMGDSLHDRVDCPFCEGSGQVPEALRNNLIAGRQRGARIRVLLKLKDALSEKPGDWREVVL